MTDFPDLKLKALVSFPASAVGRTGIDVVKSNGNFYVDLAFSDFAPPISSVPSVDVPNLNGLLWNAVTGRYVLVPLTLIGNAGSGLSEAPLDGFTYGRNSAAWQKALGLAGGTLTGPLTLNADPAGVLDAATKQYVDAHTAPPPTPPQNPQNHVSNSGFQLCAGLALATKFNNQGTGTLGTFAVTSVAYAAGTGSAPGVVTINITPDVNNQIKPNFLVQLAGSIDINLLPITAYAGGPKTALRVLTTTGNPVSKFTVLAPLGVASFTASSGTGTVVTPSDLAGVNGNGPSGWKKSVTSLLWMENDPVNFDPLGGSTQVVGMRKVTNGEEYFSQTLPKGRTRSLQGQTISAGGRIMQKISMGSGTGRYFIALDGVFNYGNTISLSLGNYQWSGLTVTVGPGVTSIVEGFAMNDAIGAVYYFTKPVGVVGAMPANYYSAPIHEKIYPPGIFNAWSIYGKTFTVPATVLGTSPFYGFFIDLMGETAGIVHWTADMAFGDMEGQAAILPATLITLNTPDSLGIPGGAIMWLQVANQTGATTYDQPLANGMMCLAAGQPSRQFSQFNIDLYGITANTAGFQ